MAAVDKIEDLRKPEDFIGHRNRGACGAIRKRGRLLYAQSTVSFCDRKKNRSFFAFLARLIGRMAAEILFSVGICKNHTVTTVMMVNIVPFV